jgi:transcription elongation factor GreA
MKYLTIEGQKKIKEELAYLTKIKRVELSKELAFATSLGDLRENSEYDAACEDFIQTENRIYELEKQLTESKIYKQKKPTQ